MSLQTVFHLVHGTFDPKAKWCRDGSPLRKELERLVPNCTFEIFDWNGYNSHEDRWRAGEGFRKALLGSLEANAMARHVILAHSHGGMVALYALKQMTNLDRIFLVTMGTPFLDVRPREVKEVVGVCAAVFGVATFIATIGVMTSVAELLTRAFGLPESLPVVACISSILPGTKFALKATSVSKRLESFSHGKAEKYISRFGVVSVKVPTLALRVGKDEALRALKAVFTVPAVVAALRKWSVRGLLISMAVLVHLAPLAFNGFEFLQWICIVLFAVMVLLMVAAPTLVVLYALLPVATARSLVLWGKGGWESPIFNLACTVRASFCSEWVADGYRTDSVCQFDGEPSLDGEDHLKHNAFMRSKSAISTIVDWLNQPTKWASLAEDQENSAGPTIHGMEVLPRSENVACM